MSRKVNFHAKFGFRFSFHNGFSRKRIFSTKFIDKVRFGFQFSRKIFSNNLFRKSRREAFSVSSENMLPTTFRGLKMWRKPTPSLYKYNQNFKLNNCAISKIPETSHIFKPLLNAVLYFRNLKDNATFYRKVWFSAFHCHANLICRAKFGFPQRIFNTKLFGKVRFRFHLSRKSFRQVFLKLSNRKIGAKRSA